MLQLEHNLLENECIRTELRELALTPLVFLLSLQKGITDYKQMFKWKAPSSTIFFLLLLCNSFRVVY